MHLPQINSVMKSAYRSVMFYIGQRELEMQYKMNRVVAQCRQKCESMQEKFTEKLEQLHTAYQKIAKRCQMMEQEIDSLSKDKQELEEKFSEKSRSVNILFKAFIRFIRLCCESGSSNKHQ
jgi:E3 ubiquitin-protein ligase CCNP1IP1